MVLDNRGLTVRDIAYHRHPDHGRRHRGGAGHHRREGEYAADSVRRGGSADGQLAGSEGWYRAARANWRGSAISSLLKWAGTRLCLITEKAYFIGFTSVGYPHIQFFDPAIRSLKRSI